MFNVGCSYVYLAPNKHQQLFLDTASVDSWEKYMSLGIFHGITTNPVLLERAGIKCRLNELQKLSSTALTTYDAKCFMLQTWGNNKDELIKHGMELQEISDKIVVKVPLTRVGIEAAAALSKMDVRICMTACYNSQQAIIAAALNAEYIAPYLGRMCDAGKDGMNEVIEMQRIVESLRSSTRVFVASLRQSNQLAKLSAAGLHTFTFSPQIADELIFDPLTEAAAQDFERAASL